MRVLERMGGTELNYNYNDRYDVYDAIQHIPGVKWEDVLLGGKLSFKINVRANRARDNQRIIMMRAKDGIRDRLRACGIDNFNIHHNNNNYNYNNQDDGDAPMPDVPLFITVNGDSMVVYKDLVGASLHKRGYHAGSVHRSALNETVAAGMAYISGMDAYGNGNDALLKYQIAPGLLRKRAFSFENSLLPDFDARLLRDIRDEARAKEAYSNSSINIKILGCDRHGGAVQMARDAVWEAGLDKYIEIAQKDINDLRIREKAQLVLCNPPWGKRLDDHEYADAWKDLGYWAKNNTSIHAQLVVISGQPQLTREIRMKARRKYPVRIGNVDCRILTYDVLPKKKNENEFENTARNVEIIAQHMDGGTRY